MYMANFVKTEKKNLKYKENNIKLKCIHVMYALHQLLRFEK